MKQIIVPLSNKLIAVLEQTKLDMLNGCRHGIAKAIRREEPEKITYWEEEMEDIKQLTYEELHELFIDVQYRNLTA